MLAAFPAACRNLLKRYLPLQYNASTSTSPKRQRMVENGSGDNCQMKNKSKMKITVDKAPSPKLQQKTPPPIKEPDQTNTSDVDLTGKIKCDEIKLGNKLRYQIFVPEVNDVQIEKLESKVRVTFDSKQKDFCKTNQKKSREYYFIDIKAETDDIEDVILHTTKRKSFEIEYNFKPGKAPTPPPPPPPPPAAPPSVNTSVLKKTPKSPKIEKEEKVGRCGYTGLINVGNTCFMASVLQCLANVPELRNYFRTEEYVDDINEDNVLGTGGAAAHAFHRLLEQLWNGKNTAIKPSEVKRVVGERAPQFQGYSQHDAQEFCAYILDLLHEDVNQVKKKPYVEQKEADGRPDDVVAQESWEGFCSRNKSKLVDLFYGQYKSRLDCPKCNKTSVTFDPYVYLSVPMPSESRKVRVLFFYKMSNNDDISSERQRPRRLELTISKAGGHVNEVIQQVARLTNTKAENLKLFEAYKSRIRTIYSGNDNLGDIEFTDTIVICEVDSQDEKYKVIGLNFNSFQSPEPIKCNTCGIEDGAPRKKLNEDGELDIVSLVRCGKCLSVWYCGKECQEANWTFHKPNCDRRAASKGIGIPVYVTVPIMTSKTELDEIVLKAAEKSIKYKWSEAEEDDEKEPRVDLYYQLTTNSGIVKRDHRELIQEWKNDVDLNEVTSLDITFGRLTNDQYADRKKMPRPRHLEKIKAIPLDELPCDNVSNTASGSEDNITLDRCIEMFSEAEILEENEYWYCSTCKDHVPAKKQISLYKLPRILVFHLKRFQYKASKYFKYSVTARDKIKSFVDYDVSGLDMGPYCIDPSKACPEGKEPIYDLVGVVNHMGTMSYGHYTASVRHPDKREVWRKADDSHVREIPEKQAKSEYAYLLFYQLRENETETNGVQSADLTNLSDNLKTMNIDVREENSDSAVDASD